MCFAQEVLALGLGQRDTDCSWNRWVQKWIEELSYSCSEG